MSKDLQTIEGGCTCREIRYQLLTRPMIVHCCHCYWCQRETGTAFALNALIESDRVQLLNGMPVTITTPSASGAGQDIVRCPTCMISLWSHYGGRKTVMFLRVGTLDQPNLCPPDIHIFTESKQDWVILPDNVPAVPEYYQRSSYWSEESVIRYRTALEQ